MAEWVKQQAEREAEKEQRRLERLQRKLAEPAHCFASPDYQRQCHEMAERLEDSVLKGKSEDSSTCCAGFWSQDPLLKSILSVLEEDKESLRTSPRNPAQPVVTS